MHPGEILDKQFEIQSVLGSGGQAAVYKARDLRLGRTVAIKIIHAPLAEDPNAVERFKRESKLISQLRHKNILACYKSGQVGESLYLCLEYVESKSLAHLLTENRLAWRQALELCMQVSAGMAAAHKEGIIHRDLSPANILLVDDGQGGFTAKVADFGLARDPRGEQRLTGTGMILGCLEYMAPEQLKGTSDPRSDIYSLGCILYQCLNGELPFQFLNAAAALEQHDRQPPALSKRIADLPSTVDQVIKSCLAAEPADRYQSMSDLGSELANVLANRPLQGLAVGRMRLKFNFNLARSKVIAATALIALACVVLFPAYIAFPVYLLLDGGLNSPAGRAVHWLSERGSLDQAKYLAASFDHRSLSVADKPLAASIMAEYSIRIRKSDASDSRSYAQSALAVLAGLPADAPKPARASASRIVLQALQEQSNGIDKTFIPNFWLAAENDPGHASEFAALGMKTSLIANSRNITDLAADARRAIPIYEKAHNQSQLLMLAKTMTIAASQLTADNWHRIRALEAAFDAYTAAGGSDGTPSRLLLQEVVHLCRLNGDRANPLDHSQPNTMIFLHASELSAHRHLADLAMYSGRYDEVISQIEQMKQPERYLLDNGNSPEKPFRTGDVKSMLITALSERHHYQEANALILQSLQEVAAARTVPPIDDLVTLLVNYKLTGQEAKIRALLSKYASTERDQLRLYAGLQNLCRFDTKYHHELARSRAAIAIGMLLPSTTPDLALQHLNLQLLNAATYGVEGDLLANIKQLEVLRPLIEASAILRPDVKQERLSFVDINIRYLKYDVFRKSQHKPFDYPYKTPLNKD